MECSDWFNFGIDQSEEHSISNPYFSVDPHFHKNRVYISLQVISSLKSGSKLVLLEKLKKRLVGKSREDQVSGHTLALSYVKKELQDAGFTIRVEIEDFGQWEEDPAKTMWVLIAEKL